MKRILLVLVGLMLGSSSAFGYMQDTVWAKKLCTKLHCKGVYDRRDTMTLDHVKAGDIIMVLPSECSSFPMYNGKNRLQCRFWKDHTYFDADFATPDTDDAAKLGLETGVIFCKYTEPGHCEVSKDLIAQLRSVAK